MDEYTQGIQHYPDCAALFTARALIYLVDRQPRLALQDCDEAIRLDPNEPMAYHHRGQAQTALGWQIRAIKDFDRAIMLSPATALLYFSRGQCHIACGNNRLAERDFQTAVALDGSLVRFLNPS